MLSQQDKYQNEESFTDTKETKGKNKSYELYSIRYSDCEFLTTIFESTQVKSLYIVVNRPVSRIILTSNVLPREFRSRDKKFRNSLIYIFIAQSAGNGHKRRVAILTQITRLLFGDLHILRRLSRYPPMSCILFSLHFLLYSLGELVKKSRHFVLVIISLILITCTFD